MRQVEKTVMLKSLDIHWKEHLAAMDHLRQGIHLRGYAQKDPAQEYKREAFLMFSELLENIKRDVISTLCRIEIRTEEPIALAPQPQQQNLQFHHAPVAALAGVGADADDEFGDFESSTVNQGPKVGRNDPCPCGSNKKFKQCHGRL